jgi:glutathione-regulated potassium-efflux system ancillary protein KefC
MGNEILVNAVVYLLAAVLAVPLAHKLGLGAVLGYLLAGTVIGPWGLGLISDVGTIMHFAEFGVVLLLFLIGLELEPQRLWALRRPIFGWGTMQVLVTAAVLAGAAALIEVDLRAAVIAGLGLALSSTAIALTVMEDRNMLGSPPGQAGFAILLFQDIAAIPMIALLPLLAPGAAGGVGGGWLQALKTVAIIGGLILGGRVVVCPALDVLGRTRMREIFTAFALLLVLSIALVMQWLGLSMALGAFLAGVLLAHSEYRHELESDLEPFKGLLLGLFFTSVGMSVDFGVLAAHLWLVVGLAAAFLALKLGLLIGLGKLFHLGGREAVLFAVLLAQGGEFAFVVFGAAAEVGALTGLQAKVLVLVVTLSMMVSPLLLVLHDRVFLPSLRRAAPARSEEIVTSSEGHVIIAGFGRFGQIVGRLLNANQVPLTILDHNAGNLDVVTVFGFKVFYGDATRSDLLSAAGAGKARALVVAIDSVEDSLKLAAAVRRDFPGLPVLARARDLTHAYQLMDLGVTILERETFESALMLGRRTLEQLGFGAWLARQAAMRFRQHNVQSVHAVYPFYKDREQYVSRARQARNELNEMFERDFVAIRRQREEQAR